MNLVRGWCVPGAAWLLVHQDPGHAGHAGAKAPEQLWQCPMHPSIVQDHPGTCPICGMKLVAVPSGATPQADLAGPHAGHGAAAPAPPPEGLATVTIDPSRQQLIGLKTAPVEPGAVGGNWRTVGKVAIDETRVRHINIKFSGFVEQVYVDFIGKPVAKGQALFTIYSPDLVAAQEEYLIAVKTRTALSGGSSVSGDGDELVASARRKLQLWDIPAADIEHLEKTGQVQKSVALRSPIAGVVVKKDVVDGMQLSAGAMPYEIVDLSSVWVLADIYEGELAHVKVGMPAALTLKAYPLQPFTGRVAFIDPMLDPKTRTVKVRLTFANPTRELKPEMFGEVVLHSASREALRIPADAIINSGTKTVVFVALGDGKFQPRAVKVGDSDGQFAEVVDGLAASEQVVTRANFLVDSESRLRASLGALDIQGGKPPAGGAHAGHGGP